jgi:cation diffusion facilitator CzcD-associated flavoprotein CzcO
VAENTFSKIEVFEQRSSVGGVWCATPTETVDVNFTIPRTQPSQIPSIPAWTGPDSHSQFAFVSPVYDSLDTNIPHTLMNYSDQAFPVGSSLFPPHTVVREYLERYADDIRPYLSLGTQVLDISPAGTQGGKWIVAVKDVATGKERKETFDAVVVANGHYDDPYVPSIKGIQEWNAAYPATISHSKFYRRPDEFINKVSNTSNSEGRILLNGSRKL